jgi:hypothetical protein
MTHPLHHKDSRRLGLDLALRGLGAAFGIAATLVIARLYHQHQATASPAALALLALAMVGFALASAAAALMVVGGHLLDRQEVPRPLIDMHRPGKTGGWRR